MMCHLRRAAPALDVAATAILCFVSLVPPPAAACVCSPLPSPLEAIGAAEAVFTGRAVRVEYPDRGQAVGSSAGTITVSPSFGTHTYTFEDIDVWKGILPESVRVHTMDDGACGYRFELGEEYLVYCYPSASGLRTGCCMRTCPIEQSSRDRDAFRSLSVVGDPSQVDAAILDGFLAQVQSPDSTERMHAYAVLGRLGSRDPVRVLDALRELYWEGSDAERVLAIESLPRESAAEGGLELLREALDDESPQVRAAGLSAAPSFEMGDAEIRSVLDRGLRDAAPHVRVTAVGLLARDLRHSHQRSALSPDESLTRLLSALRDPDPRVRGNAAHAFVGFDSGDPLQPARSAVPSEPGARAGRPIRPDSSSTPAVRSALLQSTRDPDPSVRAEALSAVASFHPREPDIQRVLLAALADSSERVRFCALSWLSAPGPLPEETLAALTRVVRNDTERLRATALRNLANFSESLPVACDSMAAVYFLAPGSARLSAISLSRLEAREPGPVLRLLSVAARDSDPRLRAAALYRTRSLSPGLEHEKLELLAGALADTTPEVRMIVIDEMGAMGSAASAAVPALERVASGDAVEAVRDRASAALSAIRAAR